MPKNGIQSRQRSSRLPHLINKNPDHLTRDSHGIRREDIPRNALTVTDGLVRKGYQAYLVGGCVRDLVAGLEPLRTSPSVTVSAFLGMSSRRIPWESRVR